MPKKAPKTLYKEFSKNLTNNKKEKPKKCKAILKNCKKCGYHFSKEEHDLKVCPKCGAKRETCGNWALPGKDVCRKHGGKGGRPMVKGVHISQNSFTKDEWETIKKNMKQKNREHEFAYQVATMAFKKIIHTLDGSDPKTPVMILEAASVYFSKIARYVQEIDKLDDSMVHIHHLDEASYEKLKSETQRLIEKYLRNCILMMLGLIRQFVDSDIYNAIYNKIPENYRKLIESQKQIELKKEETHPMEKRDENWTG